MESLEDSNCHSMSDSFSLYERYLRSFNVVNNFTGVCNIQEQDEQLSSSNCDYESSNSGSNIELSAPEQSCASKHCLIEPERNFLQPIVSEKALDRSSLDTELYNKIVSPCTSPAASFENSCATVDHCMNEKSDPVEVPVSSEDSKSDFKHPVFISSTMENSNNAVDSVPMFRDVRPTEGVFKLPIRELSFNGTIKHVQKLRPIVDPITALTSANAKLNLDDKTEDQSFPSGSMSIDPESDKTCSSNVISDISEDRIEKSESTGDSQYEESKKECVNDDNSAKWNLEQSYSSLEASFDSGVRSPDMFSDDDAEAITENKPFWSFLKEFEAFDRRKVIKIEETLKGVLPPPSVTVLKTDVTEMLKKYYCFLPAFTDDRKVNDPEVNSITPTKRVSFVEIPVLPEPKQEGSEHDTRKSDIDENSFKEMKSEVDTSISDRSIELNMCTEVEATETLWPDVLKCKHYDVYYNRTSYSEKYELLALRYGERYVGAETDTSVNIHSGGFQSPSSASKRKALRLKLAQAKSPGRRLSHLARRRQAFCSAATINEKAQASNSKMVLIDKNYFPHRKLINTSERRSPRTKRTPGKKTPIRKTPGKKTPAKTPKTRSGGSSKKKAMRRLLMDPENLTRSQPTRETLKRALFISPENRKSASVPCSSVPIQAMKSKRALFGSPVNADTKSLDGTQSDQFLKRKRDALGDTPEMSRSKIAKSLSFGGDSIGGSQSFSITRRASEVFSAKNSAELNETHKKKLLWAVSEALRVHGWRMSSPGFREKASSLAQLTRKLLTIPCHAARLAAPKLSTSETMLKLARQYVFAIIQGRTVEDCFEEEQNKVTNETNSKISGYISASAYQQIKARQTSTFTSQIKENTCNVSLMKSDQPKSSSKNILQDKLVNIDPNSNSSSGVSMFDKVGLFKSNSMPSFEEAAKMRARRQISFDNVEFPKR